MADELPYGPRGFRTAPLTYEEAKRIEAEKRWADIRMAQAAEARKRASSPAGVGPNERGEPPTLMDQAVNAQPNERIDFGGFFKEKMPFVYGLFTGAPPDKTQDTRPRLTPDNWQWAKDQQKRLDEKRERLEKNRPDYDKQSGIATLPAAAAAPAPAVPAPEAPVEPAAAAAPMGGLEETLASLRKFFGPAGDYNPKQDVADANAEADRQKTKLLAQLALASGLTSAGGGSWKEIGKGFAAAGEVYDDGFRRYQNALQDSADRYQRGKTVSQGREDAFKEAALNVHNKQLSEARQRIAERQKIIDKFYSDEIEAAKSDLGADPNQIADIMRRRQRSLTSGEYVAPGGNVSDT